MAFKMCSKCELTKPTYEFNHRLDTADELKYVCKACNVEHVKQWRDVNQARIGRNMHNR